MDGNLMAAVLPAVATTTERAAASINVEESKAVAAVHSVVVVPTVTTTIATVTNAATISTASAKTLKRCLSVPIIHTLPQPEGKARGGNVLASSTTKMTTRSAAAAAAAGRITKHQIGGANTSVNAEVIEDTPKKHQQPITPDSSTGAANNVGGSFINNLPIGVPRSNPCSREVSPAPMFNIFAPRARRYSASGYCPLGAAAASAAGGGTPVNAPLCLTPRVSQLRQEECVDMNSREVNHEREVHSAMQMSQSWEDLTLVTENWSCKSDEFSNPLQVVLPSGVTSCSSPSPTSNRAGLRLPYGLSPSPTRRTFATRRSMSPIAMRPSQLGPVKRKFELEDNSSTNNWNVYSPPPLKKIFTESRGSSPVCQSPASVCPSPDSGTYDGRITPKLFISKLCTTNNSNSNNNNSACSSPMSASPSSTGGSGVGLSGVGNNESAPTSTLCASSLSSSSSSSGLSVVSGGSEPMCIGSTIDEGISISEQDEKQLTCSTTTNTSSTACNTLQPMCTDMQDDTTLMDDMKSETSSIGGCSSISLESSSCDSGAKAAATFLNKLNVDDVGGVGGVSSSSSPTTSALLGLKHFYINKQGMSGPKKYIVNHEHLSNITGSGNNSNSEALLDSISVSSTTSNSGSGRDRNGSAGGGGASVESIATVAATSSVIVEHNL